MSSRARAAKTVETLCRILRNVPSAEEVRALSDALERVLEEAAPAGDSGPAGSPASEDRLRRLLYSSPAVLYAFEATGDFSPTFVSENVARLIGYEPHEYLEDAQFWRSHVHPDDLTRVESESDLLFRDDESTQEYRFRHKDGGYRWLHDEQRLIRDADGAPVEVVGSWSDITDRRQAEDELMAARDRLDAQRKILSEMSTPVTQVWEGILLLPIVGIVDSERAQEIMDATLSRIAETRAQTFILDISGVAVVDTAVANHLMKIAKASGLMGCECVLSGISPAIAQTIVELGIDVGTVRTVATLREALADLFRGRIMRSEVA